MSDGLTRGTIVVATEDWWDGCSYWKGIKEGWEGVVCSCPQGNGADSTWSAWVAWNGEEGTPACLTVTPVSVMQPIAQKAPMPVSHDDLDIAMIQAEFTDICVAVCDNLQNNSIHGLAQEGVQMSLLVEQCIAECCSAWKKSAPHIHWMSTDVQIAFNKALAVVGLDITDVEIYPAQDVVFSSTSTAIVDWDIGHPEPDWKPETWGVPDIEVENTTGVSSCKIGQCHKPAAGYNESYTAYCKDHAMTKWFLHVGYGNCHHCGGAGKVYIEHPMKPGVPMASQPCPKCQTPTAAEELAAMDAFHKETLGQGHEWQTLNEKEILAGPTTYNPPHVPMNASTPLVGQQVLPGVQVLGGLLGRAGPIFGEENGTQPKTRESPYSDEEDEEVHQAILSITDL